MFSFLRLPPITQCACVVFCAKLSTEYEATARLRFQKGCADGSEKILSLDFSCEATRKPSDEALPPALGKAWFTPLSRLRLLSLGSPGARRWPAFLGQQWVTAGRAERRGQRAGAPKPAGRPRRSDWTLSCVCRALPSLGPWGDPRAQRLPGGRRSSFLLQNEREQRRQGGRVLATAASGTRRTLPDPGCRTASCAWWRRRDGRIDFLL